MRYLSVCSGIEAASVAWHQLGWEPAAFCEIEAFPSAVLKERYPHVVNYGDFTRLTESDHPIRAAGVDLLVGGTPCQAFSVAGLRRGLADPRGGLTLEFVRLAQALRPKWIVWENVPGVLSQDGGGAFGSFLGSLGELGYGWAYRVLDAQYVRVDGYPHAVPQRRRRVFVVGCAGGDFARAAAVLLEPEGVRGNPPTRRATRQGAASDAAGCAAPCFWNGQPVAESLTCTSDDQRMPDKGRMQMVVHPVIPYDLFQITAPINRQNRDERSPCHTLARDNAAHAAVVQPMSVRRLTPTECERLQGFPDGWTQIVWNGKPASDCPDGPRYKALGNSMACNVMRWIGRRIELVEAT